MFCGIIKTLLIVCQNLIEFIPVGSVFPLVFPVSHAQQQWKVRSAVCIDFSLFQNIESHHKEAQQMHRVLVQMIVILLPVSFSKVLVFLDNIVHLRPQPFVIPQWIMGQ